jgi:hypothetical protein
VQLQKINDHTPNFGFRIIQTNSFNRELETKNPRIKRSINTVLMHINNNVQYKNDDRIARLFDDAIVFEDQKFGLTVPYNFKMTGGAIKKVFGKAFKDNRTFYKRNGINELTDYAKKLSTDSGLNFSFSDKRPLLKIRTRDNDYKTNLNVIAQKIYEIGDETIKTEVTRGNYMNDDISTITMTNSAGRTFISKLNMKKPDLIRQNVDDCYNNLKNNQNMPLNNILSFPTENFSSHLKTISII